jgi:hypothetical protein
VYQYQDYEASDSRTTYELRRIYKEMVVSYSKYYVYMYVCMYVCMYV